MLYPKFVHAVERSSDQNQTLPNTAGYLDKANIRHNSNQNRMHSCLVYVKKNILSKHNILI